MKTTATLAIIAAAAAMLALGSCQREEIGADKPAGWHEHVQPGRNLYFQNWSHGVVRRQRFLRSGGYYGYEVFLPCLNYDPAITALRYIDDCQLGGPNYNMTSADTTPAR